MNMRMGSSAPNPAICRCGLFIIHLYTHLLDSFASREEASGSMCAHSTLCPCSTAAHSQRVLPGYPHKLTCALFSSFLNASVRSAPAAARCTLRSIASSSATRGGMPFCSRTCHVPYMYRMHTVYTIHASIVMQVYVSCACCFLELHNVPAKPAANTRGKTPLCSCTWHARGVRNATRDAAVLTNARWQPVCPSSSCSQIHR